MHTELHERLRMLRLGARLKQADIARAVGIPQSSVSQIEKGSRKITPGEAAEWADACGYSLHLFLVRADSPNLDIAAFLESLPPDVAQVVAALVRRLHESEEDEQRALVAALSFLVV